MTKRYWVVDYYDGFGIVGTTDDLDEALRFVKRRIKDSEGQCAVNIYDTWRNDDEQN